MSKDSLTLSISYHQTWSPSKVSNFPANPSLHPDDEGNGTIFYLRPRVFMLLSCIGQRSLSNSGVLEGLLNLLDSLLSPLQQPQAASQCRTEGTWMCDMRKPLRPDILWSKKVQVCPHVFPRCFGYTHDQLGRDAGFQTAGLCRQYRRRGLRWEETPWWERTWEDSNRYINPTAVFLLKAFGFCFWFETYDDLSVHVGSSLRYSVELHQ